MLKSKNAFDWQGSPSIWTADKKLKQVAAGQLLGKSLKERIAMIEKKEFTIYSRAKLKEKENG
jgi:hypothetical protein